MPTVDSAVFDPSADLLTSVKTELDTAFANEGITGEKVWHPLIPEDYDVGYPRCVFDVNVSRAEGFSNKESRSVQADVDAQVYDTDPKRLIDLKVRVVERLTDRSNFPTPTGWDLIWIDLQNDIPQHRTTTNNPDIYGRIVTVEYYLNRS